MNIALLNVEIINETIMFVKKDLPDEVEKPVISCYYIEIIPMSAKQEYAEKEVLRYGFVPDKFLLSVFPAIDTDECAASRRYSGPARYGQGIQTI